LIKKKRKLISEYYKMRHIRDHISGLVFIFILMGCNEGISDSGQNGTHVIPLPVEIIMHNGTFDINSKTIIKTGADADLMNEAQYLTALLQENSGIQIEIAAAHSGTKKSILLTVNNDLSNPEGYYLLVSENNISIEAGSDQGVFYGIQTLRQLLTQSNTGKGEISIRCQEIRDEPRFRYRGMHLDVGRHFFPVEFIKKYIDLLALHKMNTFHWHLTEDQGWRIEIKKYPELTRVGAFRNETLIGHGGKKPFVYDGIRYGGFYTQEDIKEIVAYALKRHITIIPEIEMPGHSLAALASYPHLGCTGGPYKVATRWGVFSDVYCAGNDSVFAFLEDVLDEVITIFPGRYIHIGGDECPKQSWKDCPECQAKIREEGLKDEHELQSYFITRMEKYLLDRGRYIIGWDEILEGGLAPQATVMSWRGEKGGIEAAEQAHDVIMTPNTYVYLDYYQAEPENEPLAIGGFIDLEMIYGYKPVPGSLDAEESKYILGAQGNVWTEYITTGDHVEYMTYPRATALAEVLWSPADSRDYNDFVKRLNDFVYHMDKMEVNYAKHFMDIQE